MVSRTFALAAVAAVGGCAGVFPPVEHTPSHFTFRTDTVTIQAKIEHDGLYGQEFRVAHLPDGYRGRSRGVSVSLESRPPRIVGSVNSHRTDLRFERRPEALVIRGTYMGNEGTLAISERRILGRVGPCAYDLWRSDPRSPWYEGHNACGWSRRPVRIALPSGLASRPVEEQGVFTAVFLAGLQHL